MTATRAKLRPPKLRPPKLLRTKMWRENARRTRDMIREAVYFAVKHYRAMARNLWAVQPQQSGAEL